MAISKTKIGVCIVVVLMCILFSSMVSSAKIIEPVLEDNFNTFSWSGSAQWIVITVDGKQVLYEYTGGERLAFYNTELPDEFVVSTKVMFDNADPSTAGWSGLAVNFRLDTKTVYLLRISPDRNGRIQILANTPSNWIIIENIQELGQSWVKTWIELSITRKSDRLIFRVGDVFEKEIELQGDVPVYQGGYAAVYTYGLNHYYAEFSVDHL